MNAPPRTQRRRRLVVQAANSGMPVDATPEEQVYLARRMAGITQASLSHALHMTITTVSNWETGKQSMTARDYLRALETCGYKVTLEAVE